MKKLLCLFLALVMLLSLVACAKNKNIEPEPPEETTPPVTNMYFVMLLTL